MRYLVRARLKSGKDPALRKAVKDGTLGRGSIAGGEYLRDMNHARILEDGQVRWVEVCYCDTPLAEERSYWEEYFELDEVQDALNRGECRHENGEEYWACSDCDCTEKLEKTLSRTGQRFLDGL